MRRRDFIALLPGALLARPHSVRAQQPKRLPVVGLVLPTVRTAEIVGPDPTSAIARAFIHGMRDLGWIDGRTVVFERRTAEGQIERAPALVADVLARGVDILVLGGARWLHDAAQAATRTVPTLAMFNYEPVAAGLIASFARPGGNISGVTTITGSEFHSKKLELLRELAPGITRTAFLAQHDILEGYRDVARPAGVTVIPVLVEAPAHLEPAFAAVKRERADAMLVAAGPPFQPHAHRVAAFAVENRLPACFGHRESVTAGGLMMYGPNVVPLFGQLARLTDRILKGAKPADLPTEQPTVFELIINAKAAQSLGLTIPWPLLALADEVIE